MNLDASNLSFLDPLRPILPIPLWQKAVALLATFVILMAAYLYFGWLPLQDAIDSQAKQVEQQRILLKKNQRLARDLPRKQAEYARLEKQLKVALNMLPKKSQIPDLLESVAWAGKDSGLEMTTFTPQGESMKQIYAEVPVALNVSGTFRQLLTFLKRVGEMPRIVAVQNLTLNQPKAGGVLNISGRVVTYRFVDQPKKKRKKGKRARRR